MTIQWQSILVALAILASAIFVIRHLVRTFSGKSAPSGCPGCQCDCRQMRTEEGDDDSCCHEQGEEGPVS